MLIALLVIAAGLVGLGLAVRLYMSRDAEMALQPAERVVIPELRDPLPGNSFLACPPSYCAAAAAPSPIFNMNSEQLAETMHRVLAEETEIFPVETAPETRRLTLIQRTPLLRFPDIVTIEFIALGADRSSLAIYSRSRYGKGDFGTNRKRVLRWLDRLRVVAGQ